QRNGGPGGGAKRRGPRPFSTTPGQPGSRHLGAFLAHAVVLVDEDDLRLVSARGLLVHPGERGDDDEVTGRHQVRRRAVHADHAAVGRPLDDVRLEAVAVCDVPDTDRLVGQQVGGVDEPAVDGDRALVVHVGLRHRGTVDLRPHHLARGHRSVPPEESSRLSISRTPPTHTATARSAGPVTSATSARDSGSRLPASSSRACGSAAITAATRPTIVGTAVAPPATASVAASSARGTQRAASRASVDSSRFRLDSARPSASRTVGTPTMSIPKSRSAVIRRITASCCQSFSPNSAQCGRTAWKSFVTTVVTPRKCPGRARPHSGSDTPAISTAEANPSGYMTPAPGA